MRFYNMKRNKNSFIYICYISLVLICQACGEIDTLLNVTDIYAIEGESFLLNCSTSCPENNGGELSWKYLGQGSENITERDSVILNCNEKITFTITTIINATKQDEGKYFCVLTNDRGIRSTLNISKVSVGKPILMVTTNEILRMPEGTVQIMLRKTFTVTDYPPINNWYLLKDGKKLPNSYIGKKVEFKKSSTGFKKNNIGSKHFFWVTLNVLTVSDTANYTLVLSNGYFTKNLTFEIRRKGISRVNLIEDNKQRYHIGDSITLQCEIIGYPIVPANWYFSDRNGVIIEEEKNDVKSLIRALSTVKFKLLNSSNVTCQMGKTNDTKILLVYEVNNGFEIRAPNRSWFPEGYNISVACLASKYDFNNLFWSRNKTEKLTKITKHSETKVSHVATLEINNTSMSQTALYQCVGIRINGSIEMKSIQIIIAGMKSPQIKDNNKNNDTYVVVMQPLRLSCYANAIPEPHIEWLKDDIILTNDSYVKIYEEISNWTKVNSTLFITHVQDSDIGTYVCKARNQKGEQTKIYNVILKDNTIHKMLIAATAPVIVILSIFVLYLIRLVRKEKQFKRELKAAGLYFFEKGNPNSLSPDLIIEDQAELLPYDPSFEFPRKNLILGEQLGSGAFGVVYKATASAICRSSKTSVVAAKVAKKTMDNMCIKALISELKIMMHLGKHLNIVNLLGACTKNVIRRELIVIVEYCKFGNIRTYMIKNRRTFINQLTTYKEFQSRQCRSTSCSSGSSGIQSDDLNFYEDQFTEYTTLSNSGNTRSTLDRQDSAYDSDGSFNEQRARPLSSRDLLCWAFQIARGMEYLASRKVLHGDLAARNVLLAEDNIVKICDFGLSRSLYKDEEYMKKSESPLPFKWLAIECMTDKIFSIQSDIWSFGIVLWEIFSLGKTPYPSIGVENIIKWLLQGNRLEKPPFADNRLYRIMLKCWELPPTLRPSFAQLQEELGNFLEDKVRNYYTELNDSNVELNKMRCGQKDYLDMVSMPDYNNIVTPSSHHYINEIITQTDLRESKERDEPSTENKQSEVKHRIQDIKFDFDVIKLEAIQETKIQDLQFTPRVIQDGLPKSSESDYESSLSPCPREEKYLDEVFQNKIVDLKTLKNNTVNNPTYLIYNMCSDSSSQIKVKDKANETN